MLYSLFMVRDGVVRINTLSEQIKLTTKEEDLSVFKNKFNPLAYDISLALGEARISLNDDIFEIQYTNLMKYIISAQSASNLKDFKSSLFDIISNFDEIEYSEFSIGEMNRDFRDYFYDNRSNTQYVTKHSNVLRALSEKIKANTERNISLFYPDCYDGEVLRSINMMNKYKMYGSERSDKGLGDAKTTMFKVVKGILRGSRIQNNAFDVLYCKPYVKFTIDEEDIFATKRPEKQYIADSFKYIRDDGVIVITMPYYRLYRDVCLAISKNFKDVRVVKASESDFESTGLVHIIGVKSSLKESRDEVYAELRKLFDYNGVQSFDDKEEYEYILPNSTIDIELFRGSSIDLEEVKNILVESNLLNKSIGKQVIGKLSDTVKNPLLPFSIGQLGLVLTSGCLDGIVDEGDGNKHLIKGRVSKKILVVETESEKGVEITETSVNKVEINVLLPNGEYKTLA